MAYAEDLKFSGGEPPCGFESRPRHHHSLREGLARDRREIHWKPSAHLDYSITNAGSRRLAETQSSTFEEPVGVE